jgi:hypothetical protein
MGRPTTRVYGMGSVASETTHARESSGRHRSFTKSPSLLENAGWKVRRRSIFVSVTSVSTRALTAAACGDPHSVDSVPVHHRISIEDHLEWKISG